MGRWCNELLVRNSWRDAYNFSKQFNTNFKLLIVKLKLVRRRLLDLGNSDPELLQVDLRNLSSDEESFVTWRKLEKIQNNLICGFLLLLIGINSHVARANLNSISSGNQCFIKGGFELALTCMIDYDLNLLEIITFASSLQYHRESCYLVNLEDLLSIREAEGLSNMYLRFHHVFMYVDRDLTSHPSQCLFDVGTGRISIVTVNTVKYDSDVLARSQG
ncbi:hypothetical protein Tco_0332208 [Tanacetum coccineum]